MKRWRKRKLKIKEKEIRRMEKFIILSSLLVRNEILFSYYTLCLGCGLQKIITVFEM